MSTRQEGDLALEAADLGTKEYWDAAYRREVETFDDCGDCGEIWFGQRTLSRVVQW
jgi:hypothetical protein